MRKIIFFILTITLPGWVFCQVNITSGTYLVTAGNVQVVVDNLDFINNGTLFSNNSTFQFTGASSNTISGINNTAFDNFSINKTGTRQVMLETNIIVNNQVNFLSGLIELNNYNLHLMGTGNLIGESETSRIKAGAGGYVITIATLNAPNGVNPGNLGAVISSPANMGNVQIKRGHTSQNAPDANGKTIDRVFVFNVGNNTNLNASLKLKYLDAELNGIDEGKLSMYSTDFNVTYYNINYATRDAAANFVSQDNLNALGMYTLSAPAGALPVTLIDFAAQCKNNFIQLDWKTATEINSDRFEVQRSNNATQWEKIGTVKAKGNSSNVVAYQYNDNTLNTASAYYRLAQYDADGKVVYSPIVKAGCGQSEVFKVIPNPVLDAAKVTLSATTNGKGTLLLYNASGQLLMQQAVSIANGLNQYAINMSPMAKGNYNLVLVQNGATSQTIKIIKQ